MTLILIGLAYRIAIVQTNCSMNELSNVQPSTTLAYHW